MKGSNPCIIIFFHINISICYFKKVPELFLRKFFIILLSRAKGREIFIDDQISFFDLLPVIFEKALNAVRGLILTRRLISVGKGTKIRSLRNLHFDSGVEIGQYSRLECLSKNGLTIGRGSSIGSFSIIRVSGTLSNIGDGIHLGSNVGLGEFTHIGGAGGTVVGDDTICGAYLSIHPENHIFNDRDCPIRLQGVSRMGVSIGKGCWIGAKATFLDGSSVGDHCVVAAGSVVTKKFPNHVLIGGVPAKILKQL